MNTGNMRKHKIQVISRYRTTPPLRGKFQTKELDDMVVVNVNRANVLGNPYTYDSKNQKKPSNKFTLLAASAEDAVEKYEDYFNAVVSYFEELKNTGAVNPRPEHVQYFDYLNSIAATPTDAVRLFRDKLAWIYQLAIKSQKPVYLASQLTKCSHAYIIANWLNKKLEEYDILSKEG